MFQSRYPDTSGTVLNALELLNPPNFQCQQVVFTIDFSIQSWIYGIYLFSLLAAIHLERGASGCLPALVAI
jgi:hypothetical protein